MNTQPTPPALEAIEVFLLAKGEKPFRIQQIKDAWYTQPDWKNVTTLSKDLVAELSEHFPWLAFETPKVFESPKDGTKKALITLRDGKKIETVYMPNARGTKTVCVSSQVGCAMACTFCATGTMGLIRNLTVDEIVDQVRFWKFTESAVKAAPTTNITSDGETDNQAITNIVFMGMGEPLANYDPVKTAVKILVNEMEIGPTRITVSSVCGPVMLNKILKDDDFPPVRVALSVHAGTDETRIKIVPTHKQTSIKNIVNWVEAYLQKRGNRRHHVTIEYVMLLNTNDMPSEAHAFVKEFGKLKDQIKLNLIPWNHTNADMQASSEERLEAFQKIVQSAGIPTTIRYSKGLDIDAACGQLVVEDDKKA